MSSTHKTDNIRQAAQSTPGDTMSTPGSEHARKMIEVYRVAGEKYLADYQAALEAERGAIAAEIEALSSDLDRYDHGGAFVTDCGIMHNRAVVATNAARATLQVSADLTTNCQRAVGRAFAALPWPKP